MQKKLIALAIAAAFSAPAFAETTIYGVIDAGYDSTNVTNIATDVKTTTTGIAFSKGQTNRVGITQTEDLANGMKASYLLEVGTANATWSADRVLAGALNLGQGTTLIGGRVSSPFRGIVYGYDAMYGANFTGNLISANTNLNQRAVAIAAIHKAGDVTVSAAMLKSTVKVGSNPETDNGSGVELTATYAKDALSVAAGYRKLTSTTLNTAGTALATDNSNKSMILAGSYDLGMAKLYGQYATDTVDQAVATASSDKKTFETVGVNVPVSAELALYVELGTGKHDTGAATSPKYSASAVGVKYSMSKTTALYANYGQSKLDTVTKTDQTTVGLLHTF